MRRVLHNNIVIDAVVGLWCVAQTYMLHKLSVRTDSVTLLVSAENVPGITDLWKRNELHLPVPENLRTAQDRQHTPITILSRIPQSSVAPEPPAFILDQTQPGVNSAFQDLALVLVRRTDSVMSGRAQQLKAKILGWLQKHHPHPNSDWLLSQMEQYNWLAPAENMTIKPPS